MASHKTWNLPGSILLIDSSIADKKTIICLSLLGYMLYLARQICSGSRQHLNGLIVFQNSLASMEKYVIDIGDTSKKSRGPVAAILSS